MNEQKLRETVNPVFNTAKACVQLDAAAQPFQVYKPKDK